MLTEIEDNWFLIDLDLAIKIKDQKPSGTLSRTGTKVFMAFGTLSNNRHNFMRQNRCIGAMRFRRVTNGEAGAA